MKEPRVFGGGGGISRTSHGGLISPPGTVRTALDFTCSAIVLPPLRRDVGQNTSEGNTRGTRSFALDGGMWAMGVDKSRKPAPLVEADRPRSQDKVGSGCGEVAGGFPRAHASSFPRPGQFRVSV